MPANFSDNHLLMTIPQNPIEQRYYNSSMIQQHLQMQQQALQNQNPLNLNNSGMIRSQSFHAGTTNQQNHIQNKQNPYNNNNNNHHTYQFNDNLNKNNNNLQYFGYEVQSFQANNNNNINTTDESQTGVNDQKNFKNENKNG
jgi:hypothetical protein